MKTSEDFISCDVSDTTGWHHPLPKRYIVACTITLIASAVLAVFSPTVPDLSHQNIAVNEQHDEDQNENYDLADNYDKNTANSGNSQGALPETAPLADYFAKKKSESMVETASTNDATDNYDDTLPDSAIIDSDDALDDQVKILAAKDDGNNRLDELKWFEEDVQKGDTISSIFADLNIPPSVTMAILDNKKVASEVNSLRLGEHISFLLDDKSRLMAFVKPLGKDQQIRFYRDDPQNDSFSYLIEKAGAHLGDAGTIAIKDLLASQDQKREDTKKTQDENKSDAKATTTAKTDNAKQTKTDDKKVVAQNKATARERRGRLVLVNIERGETFSTAANKAGISYTEINQILQMFKGRIQFSKNIRSGDSMRVLFTDSKGKGKISAVEFSLQGRKVSSFLNVKDGKYYDERGINSTAAASFRRFPFNAKARVTSPFNPARTHPVTGVRRPHNGTDFGMPVGTPIIAPSDGVVTTASFTRSTGYYIVIRHRGAYSSVYMHLSKINVKVGQSVKMGAVIARSGNTGLSTGPHLHYELRINGRPVNAMRVKLNGIQDTSVTSERKRFANNIKNYKRDLYNSSLIAKR